MDIYELEVAVKLSKPVSGLQIVRAMETANRGKKNIFWPVRDKNDHAWFIGSMGKNVVDNIVIYPDPDADVVRMHESYEQLFVAIKQNGWRNWPQDCPSEEDATKALRRYANDLAVALKSSSSRWNFHSPQEAKFCALCGLLLRTSGRCEEHGDDVPFLVFEIKPAATPR